MESNPIIQPETPSVPKQEAPKKLRVIIGLPCNSSYSQRFLLAWTETINALVSTGRYELIVSPGSSSFVSFSRMQTLGLNVLRGKNQKPFNGDPYDVYLTLDSDIVFSPIQVMELIESTKIHPVVSGYYMMSDGKHFAAVKDWDKEYFLKNGSFEFLEQRNLEPYMIRFQEELDRRKKAVEDKKDPGPLSEPEFMKVSYAGMGFFACRKEVLDALQYPYFNRELQRMRTKEGLELTDMCSEDVSFCKNIEDAGFDIMLNTRLRVGHEKPIVL